MQLKINIFIYFQLSLARWVSVVAQGLSLAVAPGSSLQRLPLLQSTGSRIRFTSWGAWA